MSAPDLHRARPSEAGFTLVELIAVLTILALAAAAISFRIGASFSTAQFRAMLAGTAALIRDARTRAIGSARDQVFVVDLKRRRMTYAGSPRVIGIPEDVDVVMATAESERYRDGTLGIRFFPNGSSTGATLSFTWRHHAYTMRINWLTGNVSTDKGTSQPD